jgi:hypothetical protein
MAGREGFYLTLLSDGSMESFPNNTVAQFKTLLPHPLNLTDGDWEVALTEMMYSADLKNITTEEAYFDIMVPESHNRQVTDPNLYGWNRYTKTKLSMVLLHELTALVPWEDSRWQHYMTKGKSILRCNLYRIRFRAGAYTQPMALIKEINEGLERCLKEVWKKLGNPREISNMKLVYYPDYDRVMYQLSGPSLRTTPLAIRFPRTLAYKLGMDGDKLMIPNEIDTKWINVNYLGNHTVDLYENLKSMYVYCDIVDPQIVGSNELKLLRVVPFSSQGEDRHQARWEPIRAEYLKLSKKYFDTIDLHIMTSLGNPMGFLNGRSLVKLHFRKAY